MHSEKHIDSSFPEIDIQKPQDVHVVWVTNANLSASIVYLMYH